ncbi:hypothetical protein HaLaN_31142 [Haematococcus lacustris]|uniref:Uncharacterized protein n=1 Tax=Haematococcus lacustris TaxID=44745 RepID=A0A6A0AH58_HAELA|nr:hypothetical protein HaLaN_31142 [Haematococcus lacustris]
MLAKKRKESNAGQRCRLGKAQLMSTNGLIGRSPAITLSVPVVCCFVQIFLVALGGYYVLHNIHEDFPGLNPINPEHYLKIAKKAYKTLAANNMKVSVKDM